MLLLKELMEVYINGLPYCVCRRRYNLCFCTDFNGKTKLMPGRIMVILVIAGAILGAAGVYEPFAKWAKAGATVPLTGFGNLLYQGVKQAVDMEGFLGIFTGGLKAGAAGISAALIFGYIASLFFDPKIKK